MIAAAPPYTDEVEVIFVRNIVRICQLIPTIVALYDHLITFDQEVQLVWDKPWSIAKVTFLWIRYFGSFFLFAEALVLSIKPPSNQVLFSCRIWFSVQAWGTAVIIWSMQSVMLFRTFAMYRHYRGVVVSCLLCFAAEVLSIFAIFAFSFQKTDALNEPFPGLYVCTIRNAPYYLYAFWVLVIAFDCMLLALALWICIRRVQGLHGLNLSRGYIWNVLLMDSLVYFSITVVTYIASAVVWLVLPARWRKVPQGFSVAGTCVMGVRLILNLRKAYYTPLTLDLEPSRRHASFPH